MKLQTRSQQDMGLAARRVTEVKNEPWAAAYGRLCHNFPIMVLTCGLCQAVAFSLAKAADSEKGDVGRKKAHERLLENVQEITSATSDDIWGCSASEYILHTRRVLGAWIYYKRFAVSILDVKEGGNDDQAQG